MTCWLCRHETSEDNACFVHVDLVWLCMDCLIALAEQALPNDHMRAHAGATSQHRRALRRLP